VVKGDGLSCSIAAASILAKVARDRLMRELDDQYPGYGFASHKGYRAQIHATPCWPWAPPPSTAWPGPRCAWPWPARTRCSPRRRGICRGV